MKKLYIYIKSNMFFILIALIYASTYTALRFALNTQYKVASWKMLYDFTAPIPYAYRVLVPFISHPIVSLGFSIKQAYMFWEFIFSFFLIIVLFKIFKIYLNRRWAMFFSVLFMHVLPFIFLFKFMWPLFYPYDTPAIFFTILGMYLILKRHWVSLVLLTAISTFNRESSILILMMFAVIYFGRMRLKKYLIILFSLFSTYFLVREVTHLIAEGNRMLYNGSMSLVIGGNNWRWNNNIEWLKKDANSLILLATMGFLPLLFIFLKKFVPEYLIRLRVVVLTFFIMLCFVGNFYEPRVFGEIVIIMYFIVSLGFYSFLTQETVSDINEAEESILSGWWKYAERVFVLMLVIGVVAAMLILKSLGVSYLN